MNFFADPSVIAYLSCAPLADDSGSYLRCYDEVYTYAEASKVSRAPSAAAAPTHAPTHAHTHAPTHAHTHAPRIPETFVLVNSDFPGTVTFTVNGTQYPVGKGGAATLTLAPVGRVSADVPGVGVLSILPISTTVHATRAYGHGHGGGVSLQSSKSTGVWERYVVATVAATAPVAAPPHHASIWTPPTAARSGPSSADSRKGVFVSNVDIPVPVTFHVDSSAYLVKQGQKIQLPVAPSREIIATLALHGGLFINMKLMPRTLTGHDILTQEHGFALQSSLSADGETLYTASIAPKKFTLRPKPHFNLNPHSQFNPHPHPHPHPHPNLHTHPACSAVIGSESTDPYTFCTTPYGDGTTPYKDHFSSLADCTNFVTACNQLANSDGGGINTPSWV